MKRALALLGLAAALLAPVAGARTLRVCADPNNLPFSDSARAGLENRIIELLARDLGAQVEYVWWAQRRGFLRNTLDAKTCDVVPGVASGLERVRTTRPVYRSSYVFVTRADLRPALASFDDPRLASLVVGVPLVGDDGANPPPADALAARGHVANVRGFPVYGDYAKPSPLADAVLAVADGRIDAAVVWGPVGGYFAKQSGVPLTVTPVQPWLDGPQRPMRFDVSMAVRKDDDALRKELDGALQRRRAEVDAVLREFGVPVVDADAIAASGPGTQASTGP
jgi:mxaJ protein